MHQLHRGVSVTGRAHRIASSNYVCNRCAAQYFHSQRRLREEQNTAPTDGQTTSSRPARPATRRQGSQMAGRMIQGLRVSAPGGFGTVKAKGRAPLPSTRSIPLETSAAPRNDDTPLRIIREPTVSRQNDAPRQQDTPRRRRESRPLSERVQRLERTDRSEERYEAQDSREPRSRGTHNSLVASLQRSSDPSADIEAAREANDVPLAQRLLKGKPTRFANVAEKQRVLKLAGELASQSVAFAPVPAAYQKLVGDKAMAGSYEAIEGVKGKTSPLRTMSHLKTALQLNDSYSPLQQQALLGFMNKMWPQQRAVQG